MQKDDSKQQDDSSSNAAHKLSTGGKIAAGFAILLDSYKGTNRASAELQAERWAQCRGCPKMVQEFSLLDIAYVPTCSVCKCALAWKIPTLTDPVQTRIQGKEVATRCPDGRW
jgi:hypothetical protein